MMDKEMVKEVVEVVNVDTDKALELGEEIMMSDYTRGFLHGGIAVSGAYGVKKLWDNRELIKLKAKALIGKAEIVERIEE